MFVGVHAGAPATHSMQAFVAEGPVGAAEAVGSTGIKHVPH
jgi:hypothetical protein